MLLELKLELLKCAVIIIAIIDWLISFAKWFILFYAILKVVEYVKRKRAQKC